MTTRRQFITSASAAIAGLSAGPALAQGWTVPQDFMPRLIQHGREYYAPGEVHVEPTERRLYWVLNDGYAIRYTVGIGRAGLYESGDFTIGAKKEWPSWTPTPDMIERDPDSYEQYADGMPGGPENPLGARALYLFSGNRDTFLRIHGTNVPWTINSAVSNGCVRLVNSHIAHLYTQVPIGTRAVLH
ncbi:MAG: hypothetical protein HLUCCA08_02280 [Rhodobacteraceae bacterium HLUCCA08]|nr:MAG: hypothetical protein HLUCCA08_02280 [Rhodobacteraceae bacterium HLUCCA08]